MKTCKRCGQTKSLSEFHKNPRYRDGLSYQCKVCKREIAANWRNRNRERKIEADRDYYLTNRDVKLKQQRESYHKRKLKTAG